MEISATNTHTIYGSLSHKLEYQGLEPEGGTKIPHYGMPVLEQV